MKLKRIMLSEVNQERTDKDLFYREYKEAWFGKNKWSKIVEPENWSAELGSPRDGGREWLGGNPVTIVEDRQHFGGRCGVGTWNTMKLYH